LNEGNEWNGEIEYVCVRMNTGVNIDSASVILLSEQSKGMRVGM